MRTVNNKIPGFKPAGNHAEKFRKWKDGSFGAYLKHIWAQKAQIEGENVLFFDIEFFSRPQWRPKPKLVVWHETKASNGHRKHDMAWWDEEEAKERCLRAFRRADRIVGYNSRSLDYPALAWWGLEPKEVLLKHIDLYEFVFQRLSYSGTGSLTYISALNGGPEKIERKDRSKAEFQRQCQGDVKMLEHLFWKVLSGRFLSPLLGIIDSSQLWPDKAGRKEVAPSKDFFASALERIQKVRASRPVHRYHFSPAREASVGRWY